MAAQAGADAAAVGLDGGAGDGEADAKAAGGSARGVRAVKALKKVRELGLGEAAAGV